MSEGSGETNEDGFGLLGTPEDISAAWVFDGVTGINACNVLGGETDASWLVAKADARLLGLAAQDMPLTGILEHLVGGLISDFAAATSGLDLAPDYDPPAACLILAKRYRGGWQALRLGDSCLLTRDEGRNHMLFTASPNNTLDNWLMREVRKRREDGVHDMKTLLAEFAPDLRAGRAKRNRHDGYSILECSRDALAMPQIVDLGAPAEILLCTDGYYRSVDHYGLTDDEGLLDASAASVTDVLLRIRAAEAGDPGCVVYPRFKPADDATAVMLAR